MFTCIECNHTYRDIEGNYDERICEGCMDAEDEGETNEK